MSTLPTIVASSPIEDLFFTWFVHYVGAKPRTQVPIGPYFADFLLGGLIVELDGQEFHSSAKQRTHDAKRDRFLMLNGYRVIRFTGQEVYKNPLACVKEAIKLSGKTISYFCQEANSFVFTDALEDEINSYWASRPE